MPRRPSLALLAALALPLACSDDEPAGSAAPPGPPADPVTLVSPQVGTGGFGFNFGSAFVGAAWPQGLVKVGPDTTGPWADVNFLHYSGYWSDDDKVRAFSHLHLHGTGATDYGVLGLMPLVGFDASRIPRDGHTSPFRKETEQASPGRYAVTLDRDQIDVELVASAHVAHHRYRFPAGAEPSVLVDLAHHLSGGTITEVDATSSGGALRGRLHSVGGMSGGFGGYDVFFELRSSRPWLDAQTWAGSGVPAAGDKVQLSWDGLDEKAQPPAGFALRFAPSAEPLELQVALSLTSAAEAAANLAAEAPAFDHDGARQRAEGAWRPLVGAITIDDPAATDDDRRTVASALYHLYLMGTYIGDADGSYRGADGQVHRAEGFAYASDLSLWDTYRTLHPMLALLAPGRDRDLVISLQMMAQQAGSYPRWPIATGEAGTMIGAPADIVIADAYLKGITDFDAADAYARLRAAALDPQPPPGGRGGRDDAGDGYLQLGYVPASIGRSVSKTVEYALADQSLAGLARALGHDDDAATLEARAQGWRKLFDPDKGFLRGRHADGSLGSPTFSSTSFSDDFAEATAWHTVFGPLHDVEGLASLLGGNEALVARLSDFFERGRAHYEEHPPDGSLTGSGMRPHFWASNEPCMHIPYLFAQAGRPDLTQTWVRWVQRTFFRPTPDGLPGNDDGGTMSAWYLFNALGFYPVAGTDLYLLGAPTFARLTVHLAGGDLVIEAPGVSDARPYARSVTLDGKPVTGWRLRHADLKPGSVLRFEMSDTPLGRSPVVRCAGRFAARLCVGDARG